jgi:hypothetical protein
MANAAGEDCRSSNMRFGDADCQLQPRRICGAATVDCVFQRKHYYYYSVVLSSVFYHLDYQIRSNFDLQWKLLHQYPPIWVI